MLRALWQILDDGYQLLASQPLKSSQSQLVLRPHDHTLRDGAAPETVIPRPLRNSRNQPPVPTGYWLLGFIEPPDPLGDWLLPAFEPPEAPGYCLVGMGEPPDPLGD